MKKLLTGLLLVALTMVMFSGCQEKQYAIANYQGQIPEGETKSDYNKELFYRNDKQTGIADPFVLDNTQVDGYYYMYFKEDLTQKIAWVRSKNLTGPYNTDYTICSLNYWGVECSSMYRINGTDSWMMIMDEYGQDSYFAQMTKDFTTFKRVQRSTYSMDHLKPRHGSVVAISEAEYAALVNAYGMEK